MAQQATAITNRVEEIKSLPDKRDTDVAAHPAGNTIPAVSRVRARGYLLTIFNDPIVHFEKATCELVCHDTCKDGKEHFHQFIYFKNPIAWSSIKKKYKTAHIEIARNAYEAAHYIIDNKNGRKETIYQSGEIPAKNGFVKINEVKKMTQMERDELPLQYFNIVNKMNDEEANDIDIDEWKKDVQVYWIMGPSGIGKTERAKEIVRENVDKYGRRINEVKYKDPFWSGIGTAKIAIYDDFRDSHMHPSEFINFIDYNMHSMNVKGGRKQNHYSLIIITSVQDPHYIYMGMKDEEPRRQWLRRMTIVDLTPLPREEPATISEDIDFELI